MLFLDEEQVRKHLRMADLIPAMEKALIDFSAGKVTQPVRQVISVDPPGGFYGMMPALTPEGLGQKIVTFYPRNSEKGIPTHMALIVLNDPQTGTPLAVMDGRLITEMRTAAVSAAATKLLAPKNSKVLAILGSGVQARSHIEALRLVRNFEDIRVWSPNKSHAESFAKEIGARSTSSSWSQSQPHPRRGLRLPLTLLSRRSLSRTAPRAMCSDSKREFLRIA